MKTAVSIPDPLFEAAERLAGRLGLNRSQLYARALQSYLADTVGDEVTSRLDEVYAEAEHTVDGARAGRSLIVAGIWEW